jgi:hypothetical protein
MKHSIFNPLIPELLIIFMIIGTAFLSRASDEVYSNSSIIALENSIMQPPDTIPADDKKPPKEDKGKDKDKDTPPVDTTPIVPQDTLLPPADTVPPPTDTDPPPPIDTVPPPVDTVPLPPVDTVPPPTDPPVDTVPPPTDPPVDTIPPPVDTDPDPVTKPTAVISGSVLTCPGQQASLSVTLTGTAPWRIAVLRNGNTFSTISNIPGKQYTLHVNEPGTYTVATVTDAVSSGTGNGSGTVNLYNLPTAVISGGNTICNNSNAEISVALTGTSPWRISYQLNSGSPQAIQNISSSTYTFSVNDAGTYSLVEVADQHCKGTVSGSSVVSFISAPDVSISGLESSYSSKSEEWVELQGTPAGGVFSGKGVLEYNNTWYFLPGLVPVGPNIIVYQYRSSSASCYGYDSTMVRVFETSAEIVFEDERKFFCRNDAPFTVTGLSLGGDNGNGTFIISGNQGLTDHNNNTAVIDPSVLDNNQYTLTFTAANGETIDRTFEIGEALSADFHWDTECFQPGKTISFSNESVSPFGSLSEGSYNWTIHNGGETVHFSNQDIIYAFEEPGNYTIDLQVINSNGCMDTISKELLLHPVIQLAGLNYFENFENTSSWQSGKSNVNNSWVLGEPEQQGVLSEGFDGAYSGANSWYTHIPGEESPAEESWIISPCFDFTGTEKPTLVAKIWRSFSDTRDGANLQYTPDNGKSWLPVGLIGDGINWYTGYYGPLASQTPGWTSIKDQDWIETRHALDFLKDESSVQFRFAYKASGDALGNDGIAIDDIGIVERNRMILIEHFTNSSDTESASADAALNSLSQRFSSNIIDIQYHTSNPPDDPFNAGNPSVPNTRQFYYNVSKVPYAIINGGTQSNQQIDYNTVLLNENQIGIQSLYDSDFRILVRSMIESNTLYVDAEIITLTDVLLNELSVRMVVIEPVITGITGDNGSTSFRNVVRAMIPDAAGLTLYREWNAGETMTLKDKWAIENANDPSTLKVVVFIQNETTREILQAALDTRGVVTGSERLHDDIDFAVFPNPVKDLLTVQFGEITNDDITLELYSTSGSLIYSGHFPFGKRTIELSTGSYAEGMYILRISTAEGLIGNRKIIIAP